VEYRVRFSSDIDCDDDSVPRTIVDRVSLVDCRVIGGRYSYFRWWRVAVAPETTFEVRLEPTEGGSEAGLYFWRYRPRENEFLDSAYSILNLVKLLLVFGEASLHSAFEVSVLELPAAG
jgi:hypothetical protein